MANSLQNLHWVYPYEKADWTDHDGVAHTTTIGRVQEGTDAFMASEDAATSSGASRPVLAPISGTVVGVAPSELLDDAVDIEILTLLEDGTQIVNAFKGVTEVPHFGAAVGAKLRQGDPIGESNWRSEGAGTALGLQNNLGDFPFWFCFVKRPREADGSMVFADDAAVNKGRGLDWWVDSAGIPELLADAPMGPPAPKKKKSSPPGLGLFFLVGGVAWALFSKKR